MGNERIEPIQVRIRIESETITIPELKPFIGKDVEIILRVLDPMSKEEIEAFLEAGKHINIDLDAITKLTEASSITLPAPSEDVES